MQERISAWLLILAASMVCSGRAQFFKAPEPDIENLLLTRATIDKIPVQSPESRSSSHHVLMELPIVKAEPIEEYDDDSEGVTLFEESLPARVNPYASSGILTPEQRHQRFRSLRPSSPFSRRGGPGPELPPLPTTTTQPPTTTTNQGLNLRSRFRFRPSLRSSKRKNKPDEEEEEQKVSPTQAPSLITESSPTTLSPSTIEISTIESSTKIAFRRNGGAGDFLRRNRPSFRRRKGNTTPAPSTTFATSVSTTQISKAPRFSSISTSTTVTLPSTTASPPPRIIKGDLFDFDAPISSFSKSRGGFSRPTTPQGATTLDIPRIPSTTSPPKPRNSLPKRRRRPRPSSNIVPISNEEEKALDPKEQSASQKADPRFRGKRVKGRRVRGNRRRKPQAAKSTTQVTTPNSSTTHIITRTTTTSTPVTTTPNVQAPSPKKKLRKLPSRRQNARADFEPLYLEETPRRSKIITQSSVQTERKVKIPEPSQVIRRENKASLKSRRNVIRSNEIERYSFEDEDGSFTWGYKTKDGSFKEETRGADCITRGRYGYVDESGEVREYKYESGVPCKATGDEGDNSLGNLEARGVGYFDYSDNRFVLPDGRRVRVKINQKHRARG